MLLVIRNYLFPFRLICEKVLLKYHNLMHLLLGSLAMTDHYSYFNGLCTYNELKYV